MSAFSRIALFVLLAIGFSKTLTATATVSAREFRKNLKAIVGERTGTRAAREAGRYLKRTLRDSSNKGRIVSYSALMSILHGGLHVRLRPSESLLFVGYLLDGYLDGKTFSSSNYALEKSLFAILKRVDNSHFSVDYALRAMNLVVAKLEKHGVSEEERQSYGRMIFNHLAPRPPVTKSFDFRRQDARRVVFDAPGWQLWEESFVLPRKMS